MFDVGHVKRSEYGMRFNVKWVILTIVAVVAVAAAVNVLSVVVIDSLQHAWNERYVSANYSGSAGQQALVVYFSRSGNTEIMAMEIARLKNAATVELVAESYRIGFWGWVNALRDAGRHDASIMPRAVDLSRYSTIYVGSPIWLYSPAPPVWEFIQRNDLSGKRVVLFNSLNSKFDQKQIDEFADMVRNKGGTFGGHVFIIRGRMTRQMDVNDFVRETRRQVDSLSFRRQCEPSC